MLESERIQAVLDELSPMFEEDGIVRYILRERVVREKERERRELNGYPHSRPPNLR